MFRLLSLLIPIFLSSPVFCSSIGQLETELNQSRYSAAVKTGRALLREQPDNVRVQFLTALAFQYDNQAENAQLQYQQIIQNYPDLPEPRNNLALIYMQQGQYDQAIELLTSSLKTHPAYATAWQNLNKLYQGLASEAYRKALSKEINPRSVMDKIQLSLLSTLHDMPQQPEIQSPEAVQPIPPVTASTGSETTAPVEPPRQNSNDELINALKSWATAWSGKDFDAYIDAYTTDYKGGRANHRTWVEYRRSRVLKAGPIKVELSNFQIKSLSETRAIIDFQQRFTSSSYKDRVSKRVYLTKINNTWKINRELTIAVL